MLFYLYRIITNLLYLPVFFFFYYRFLISKESSRSIREKFGFYKAKKPEGKIIWINAVSIGEVLSVLKIVENIKEKYPNHKILLTTTTITSANIVKQRFPKNVIHQFAPVDIQLVVKKFVDYWNPCIGIFLESEFWPNLLTYANERQIKLFSVNTRISRKAFLNWSKFPKSSKKILSSFSAYFAQDFKTAHRLKKLGIKHVFNYGNLKFLSDKLPFNKRDYLSLKKYLKDRLVIVLASSHPNEEKLILEELEPLMKENNSIFFIIIPRHVQRLSHLENFLNLKNYDYCIRSEKNIFSKNVNFMLVDTFGELGLFYRLSQIVIMGGSFVPHGGQNPIEASNFECCVLIGPHYHNFFEIVNKLKSYKAIIQIDEREKLKSTINRLLSTPSKIKKLSENLLKGSLVEKKKVSKIWREIDLIIRKI